MNISCSLLWGFYLGLGPVYWLPYISITTLNYIKLGLISGAILCSIIFALQNKALRLPSGIYGLPGFFIVVLFCGTGFIQAVSIDIATQRFLDITYGYITLWSFYLYYIASNGKAFPFILSSLLISFLSLLVITNYALKFPELPPATIYGNKSLSTAGFGALRTGWSNGISFFAIAVSFLVIGKNKKVTNLDYYISGTISVLIIGSQIAVAGRAGLLASVLGLSIVFWRTAPALSKITMPILLIILISSLIIQGDLEQHLRLDRLEETHGSGLSTLDHFSAGRITTYIYGLEKWLESPLMGHGFGQVDVIKGHEIHNLWLRLLTETGPLVTVFFFYSVVNVILTIHSLSKSTLFYNHEKIKMTLFGAIITQGLFISFLEPRMLLGSFQNCVIWWASLGAALGSIKLFKQQNESIDK